MVKEMQFLIEKRQRREMNKCLALLCALDEKGELLFSLISEDRKMEINSVLQQDTSCSDAVLESIFGEFFSLIHPENLSKMLSSEGPLLCKIILEALPEEFSERVRFYLPPEVISKIGEIPPVTGMGCFDFVIRKFLEEFISNLKECIKSQGDCDREDNIINKIITLSYEEMLELLRSAGEFALTTKDGERDIIPERNEGIFAGYVLLATLIAEESDKLKKIVLNKFSEDAQKILNSLINDRKEEIKWLEQKSEEAFRRAFRMS